MANGQDPNFVLFSRESQDGEETADTWDDTELVKEYDRAVRPLKAKVAERIGLSNAELEEASGSESCASSKSAVEKQQNQKLNKRAKRRRKRKKQHREWAVGDHCQATFTVDNKLYEATILSIDADQRTCEIQYVGYGNTEKKSLHEISQSMGEAARTKQMRNSSLGKEFETEAYGSDDTMQHSSQSIGSHTRDQQHVRRNTPSVSALPKFGETSNHLPRAPKVFQLSNPSVFSSSGIAGPANHPAMQDMVPPPLPPHVLAGLPADDSEALSAMLMSWYMSGFHTGYYQGLKRAKTSNPMN